MSFDLQQRALLIVLAIVTFSTPVAYTNTCNTYALTYKSFDNAGFFVFVFVVMFLAETMLALLYHFQRDRLAAHAFKEFVYSCVWAFFGLLASCLFSDSVHAAENFYKDNGAPDCGYAGWNFGVGVGVITSLGMGAKSCYIWFNLKESAWTWGGGGYAALDGDAAAPRLAAGPAVGPRAAAAEPRETTIAF